MAKHHLTQLNVAKLKAPLDRPSMAGFLEALEPTNALADGWPGFVWRLQTDKGDATRPRNRSPSRCASRRPPAWSRRTTAGSVPPDLRTTIAA